MTDTVTVPLVETERALISVLLTEPRTIIPVWGVLKPDDLHDVLCRRIFDACLTLAHAAKVPNPYTVAPMLPDVSLEVILDLQGRVNPQLVAEVLALADVIHQEAVYRRVTDVAADIHATAVRKPKDVDGFVYHAITMLGMAVAGQSDRPSDLASIGAEVDGELADDRVISGIPTGFQWLTDRIGGFRAGNIVALVAVYKSRKSTIARNMVLAAARARKQVALYALEGGRNDVYTDLWAMLATEKLYRGLSPYDFQTEGCLDGLHLRAAMRTPRQHQALLEARQELDDLGRYIHICDGRDGIANLERFSARMTRDHFLYHTDMIIVDHLQLMSAGRTDRLFESVEATVKVIQQFTVNEGVVSVVLSQQNEASIGGAATESYSPGVKGGGALAAAADYILTTKYDGEKAPDLLTLHLKLSRRSQPGKRQYILNASSGLVLHEAED